MMHYGSWINPQNVLDNHRCYAQYIEESYRLRNDIRDEESEQTGDETHDTITTATSGERSSSADLFRLEFAATQWSKLVSNAEGLFNKLVASNLLPHNEQDQVEQWLCMKQEYEECITNDENASLPGLTENTRRSLERIEEVTETDEKTDESANPEFRNISESCTSSESEMSEEDDENEEDDDDEEEEEDDQSDVSSGNPDFLEKLDECMKKFKFETDQMIKDIDNEFIEQNLPVISPERFLGNNINEPVPIVKPIPIRNANTRRNSMHPGSEMCNEILAFNNGFKVSRISELQDFQDNSEEIAEEKINYESQAIVLNGNRGQKDNSPDILVDALKSNDVSEPIKTLKTLTMNNEVKQTQVKMIESELAEAHKRIEELQMTIKIKEQFIADMIMNSGSRGAKQKFRKRLKKEFFSGKNQSLDEKNHQREIELCKNFAIHYEQRLRDIERIQQMAGDSAKKVSELEMSLNASKKQMETLQKQWKKEEERKIQLEAELAEDQKKIKELEKKYNLTESKLQEMRSESEDERAHSRAKSDQEKNNLLLMNYKISQMDYLSLDKLDGDGKISLRHEIQNLRRTKDRLVEQKFVLDEKLQKEKILTNDEERRRLECGETIEMIDAMIEYKNELICGRQNCEEGENLRESSEKIIINKYLSKLSEQEMKQLFYTYFRRVIDLKESSRSLELHNDEQEKTIVEQAVNMRKLGDLVEYLKLEYEEKLDFLYRHFANETGSSIREKLDKYFEYERKLRRENKKLRKRVDDLEALIRGSNVAKTTNPLRIPHQELKQIAPPPKVTRQKNKLIIQTQNCDGRK